MPIKEFLCGDCGHLWEEYDSTPKECIHCESPRIEKLFSAPGGYVIKGNNSASTRPRNSGAFKRGKK